MIISIRNKIKQELINMFSDFKTSDFYFKNEKNDFVYIQLNSDGDLDIMIYESKFHYEEWEDEKWEWWVVELDEYYEEDWFQKDIDFNSQEFNDTINYIYEVSHQY